jgi:hypothetical protein
MRILFFLLFCLITFHPYAEDRFLSNIYSDYKYSPLFCITQSPDCLDHYDESDLPYSIGSSDNYDSQTVERYSLQLPRTFFSPTPPLPPPKILSSSI